MKKQMLVAVVCATVALCSIPAARAADKDVTGLVPTIWWDFETKPDASGLPGANKGSASITFTSEGTQTYSAGAINNTYAIDTSKYTPYSGSGSFSTAGNPFTLSLVMTLGTKANGITLNVQTSTGDLIIRRGAGAGSLVVGWGAKQAASSQFLNATFDDGDAAWHLVSIVCTQTDTKLYVDGKLADSSMEFTPWSESGKATQMQFGGHLGGTKTGEAKNGGLIDDLRIHDAALAPAQIRAIAAEYGLVVLADALTVTGSPVNWGDVVPAYGITNGLSEGATVECSAVGAETETTKTIPIGYGLYSIASDGTETLIGESSATSFTYTHGADAGHLVWHWAQSNMVSVASGANGSVSEGGWVGYGDDFTVTATPGAGYKFLRWTGDTDGIDVLSAAVVLQSVTAPLSLTAEFVDEDADEFVQYVSPDGDDANAGYFANAPKKTIAAAVNTLAPTAAASIQPCAVHVAPGLYPISSTIVVTNAISIIGGDPDPSRTIVSNAAEKEIRVFFLNAPGAIVANLTMQKGYVRTWDVKGGNFIVESNGGVVSNCISEASDNSFEGAYAAGGYLKAGLVTHSVFRRCKTRSGSANWGSNRCGVLQLEGTAKAENCLFADNPQSTTVTLINVYGSSIMRNCTIVDSSLSVTDQYCKAWSALNIASGATVQNVVIAGVTNKIDGAVCPPTGSVTRFLNGAFDGDVTGLPAGTVTGTAAEFFKNYANGDYTPAGPLVGKGANYEGMASVDLAGNPRKVGSKIDIGCYEAGSSAFVIRVR